MNNEVQAIICFKCTKSIPLFGAFRIARTEDCPFCTTSLHCCKMCTFYDSTVYNECRESNAERVVDKEKANFCDYFNLSNGKNAKDIKQELLSSAESLFKKQD